MIQRIHHGCLLHFAEELSVVSRVFILFMPVLL